MQFRWRRVLFAAIFTTVLCGVRPIAAQDKVAGAGDAVSLNNQGLERYKKGKVDEAIALFRQALALNPNFPEALEQSGPGARRQRERRRSHYGFR